MSLDFKSYIRNWPGSPRSDLTHLLAQQLVFPTLIEALGAPFKSDGITHVATIDAGGLHIAPAVHQDSRLAGYHLHWVIAY